MQDNVNIYQIADELDREREKPEQSDPAGTDSPPEELRFDLPEESAEEIPWAPWLDKSPPLP
jgi:hypothetical protein